MVPADVSWQEAGDPAAGHPASVLQTVGEDAVAEAAKALRSGEPAVLLVGGNALRARGLSAAARCAQATEAKLLCETFPARIERGAGRAPVERLGYLAEFTIAQLEGARHLVLADALAPVSFFAYPGVPGYLVPEGCEVHTLATGSDDAPGALEALAEALGAPARVDGRPRPASRAARPARSTLRPWRRPSAPCSPKVPW